MPKPFRENRGATTTLLTVLLCAVGAAGPTVPASAAQEHARFLITAGTASMGISVLRVEGDAVLTPVPGSPFPTGFGVLSLVASDDGRTVYVPHAGDFGISGYRLDDRSTLTPIPGATVTVGGPPTSARLSPDGTTLFVVVGGVPGHVESFTVAPSGALTPTGAPRVPVDGPSAVGMAGVDPSGRFLRVATYLGDTVSSYAVGAGGDLTPLGTETVKFGPVAPGYTPDGRYVYVSNEFGFDVSGYALADDGRLVPTPGSPYPTGGVPHGAVASADGTRLYVPNAVGASIAGFAVHPDGALTPLPGSPYPAPTGTMPGQVALDPDGRHLYLVDVLTARINTRVHTYTIGGDGALTHSGRAPVDTGVFMSDGPVVVLTD
ncbi:lactonase family protein [Nocardia amikacinitolerans]|uniref:lactonase family protein n=1 Tax=Nocardia amikacinitolerans TaxID=756689 RepID=UPI0036B92782